MLASHIDKQCWYSLVNIIMFTLWQACDKLVFDAIPSLSQGCYKVIKAQNYTYMEWLRFGEW